MMKPANLPIFLAALCVLSASCKKSEPERQSPPPKENGAVSAVSSSGAADWIANFRSIADDTERLEVLSDTLAVGADDLEKIVSAALDDPSAEVRREAMQAFSNLEDAESLPLLTKASKDADAFVRDYAMTDIRRLPGDLVMKAYAATVSSPHPEVRSKTISALANFQNREGFELMLEATKDADPAAMEFVNAQAKALVGQTFTNYEEATSWWQANRARYDEFLQPTEE